MMLRVLVLWRVERCRLKRDACWEEMPDEKRRSPKIDVRGKEILVEERLVEAMLCRREIVAGGFPMTELSFNLDE